MKQNDVMYKTMENMALCTCTGKLKVFLENNHTLL